MKKAHLSGDVLRELYVEPPPEANEPPDIVWRLQRAMYGTRDAVAAWEREWTKNVEFSWVRVWCEQSGVAARRETGCIHGFEHGDDFITLGDDEALR